MKIGYPCSNLSIGCSAARTFRLSSYSAERLVETVQANLDCLERILRWNATHEIRLFRISSTTVPFASHPVMSFDWQNHFSDRLATIGTFIQQQGMRINVHPGQYILLNAEKDDVVDRSIAELVYHAELMDLMNLDHTHKMQIHTGGVYGNKPEATQRFVARYHLLPEIVRRRLVIENDERQYSLADNLEIHHETGIPLLFDVFHHQIFNHGDSLSDALDQVIPTWHGHGTPIMDYSSQNPEKQPGAHVQSIDMTDFDSVMHQLGQRDMDVMLEIKDKEQSALKALEWLRSHRPAAVEGPA